MAIALTVEAAAVARKRRREIRERGLRGRRIVMLASWVGLKPQTDLKSLCDELITGRGFSQRSGGAELRAGPLQVLRHVRQDRPAIGHRMMKLIERDIEGGQRAFLNRAVLEAMQGVAQNLVSLALHLL